MERKKLTCSQCGSVHLVLGEQITSVCPDCIKYETYMKATREFPRWKEAWKNNHE